MPDEPKPLDQHEAPSGEPQEPAVSPAAEKSGVPPGVALAFVIIALLGVLIVMVLRNGTFATAISGGGGGEDRLHALKSDVEARRAELNRQRVAMGLSPIDGSSEPIGEIAGRLKKDADSLVALASRYQQMLEEKDNELVAKNAELIRSEKVRQALSAEASRLQGDLQRALVGGADADGLRRDLAELKAQRDALSTELAGLRQQMKTMSAGVSEADYADLKRRLDEASRARDFYEAKMKELQGQVSSSKLFARSEDELMPAAIELFRSLRKLENKPDSELAASYNNYGVDLGATVLGTVSFETGKSELSPESQTLIRDLVDKLPDGDLLFVAGYASRTGNSESNQTLSSDRATAVAEYYAGIKRPQQLVQAVYLGQTARFSSRIPERNQICEVWHLRKKN